MGTHFRPPNKHAIKNKLITASGMVLIILVLYFTSYIWFFKTTEINLTKDITISFDGESGSANINIDNKYTDLNQRKQVFMDTVNYSAKPSENLKNGDVVEIKATYDKELAEEYHLQPTELTKQVVVYGLPERISSLEQFTPEFLRSLDQHSKEYMDKNIQRILESDFTSFFINSKPELIEKHPIYRVFLDSKSDSNTDRIVDVYSVTASGPVNISSREEKLEKKESTIYYMIIYNEINTSLKIKSQNIYGEKLINLKDRNLEDEKLFMKAMNEKYEKDYRIQILSKNVKETDEKEK